MNCSRSKNPIQTALFLLLVIFFRITWALEKIQITEGAKTKIEGKGTAWVEDGSIVKLETSQGHWLVQGLKPGHSEVQIGSARYQVLVLSRAQDRGFDILQKAAQRTLLLAAHKTNGKIRITGRLTRWKDWETLAQACRDEACDYEMQADFSKELEQDIRSQIRTKLKRFSIFPYILEFTDRVQLHIHPKNQQLEKISDFVSRYGIQLVKDSSSIDMQPLVKVQITVAEVKKDAFLSYGVQWPASYSAQVLPDSQMANSPLTLALQALESTGTGRVLASPNLLCRSGKEAEFVAGGEFPIKIMNYKVQDVVWKRYGILLKIKPLADFTGRMSISLETEISSLDTAHTVDGIPGLFTNRVQSHFDLSSPKTIALSGLIKSESGESKSGLPGLSRIPILGALFSSNDFRENRTELVIFVRPEIVHEDQEGDRP